MPRLCVILVAALAIGLFGVPSADAARHKKKTAARVTPTEIQPAYRAPARPPWAAPQECLTDEGYGRFLPCGVGDGR